MAESRVLSIREDREFLPLIELGGNRSKENMEFRPPPVLVRDDKGKG